MLLVSLGEVLFRSNLVGDFLPLDCALPGSVSVSTRTKIFTHSYNQGICSPT